MSGDIVTLIQTVGFPIVACGYLALSQKKVLEKLTDVVNNNTIMVERMLDRMDMDKGE